MASATINSRFSPEPPLSIPMDPWCREASGGNAGGMTGPAIRYAPSARAGAPAAATPGPGADKPARRQRAWRRRLRALAAPRQPPPEVQHTALERLLALLEAARAEVSAGWVQDGWWTSPADGGQQILVTGVAAGLSAPATASAVCLAGALIRAGAGQGSGSEARLLALRRHPSATPRNSERAHWAGTEETGGELSGRRAAATARSTRSSARTSGQSTGPSRGSSRTWRHFPHRASRPVRSRESFSPLHGRARRPAQSGRQLRRPCAARDPNEAALLHRLFGSPSPALATGLKPQPGISPRS